MGAMFSHFALTLWLAILVSPDNEGEKLFQSDEYYSYTCAANSAGWLPNLNVREYESQITSRLGANVFNMIRESETIALEVEQSERISLRERLIATPSHALRVKQVNEYILKSQVRSHAFYDSIDELVTPDVRQFIVGLNSFKFSLFDPWTFDAVGVDRGVITKVEAGAIDRSQRRIEVIVAMRKNPKLTNSEAMREEGRAAVRDKVEVMKLLTKEQQRKFNHFALGLALNHSKADLLSQMKKVLEVPEMSANERNFVIESMMAAITYE